VKTIALKASSKRSDETEKEVAKSCDNENLNLQSRDLEVSQEKRQQT